jgi:hypothetical protein
MTQNAMNEINSSKRLKYAIAERAEGDKILQIKAAEADAEAKVSCKFGLPLVSFLFPTWY